jgi:hypothetical protein
MPGFQRGPTCLAMVLEAGRLESCRVCILVKRGGGRGKILLHLIKVPITWCIEASIDSMFVHSQEKIRRPIRF